MTLAEAIAAIEKYQAWRLDASEELPRPLTNAVITEAINVLLAHGKDEVRKAEARSEFP